jgi:hypothetical protein
MGLEQEQEERAKMFCPNCGTDNSKGQKFCTRCGMNLLAIDRAREIVNEMTTNLPSTPTVSPNLVFVTAVLISIIGFIAVATGTVELSKNPGSGPLPTIFALCGFTTLTLICRYLLKLISPPSKVEVKQLIPPASPGLYAPPPLPHGATNRALNEASSYQSIVEDPTRQFEYERRSKS